MAELSLLNQSSTETGRKGEKGGSMASVSRRDIGREVGKGDKSMGAGRGADGEAH